jgi:protein gp37
MGQKTSIEWTDRTWNPVRGCSRVSEGCRHCYAERQAARFSGPGRPFDGFVRIQTGIGPQWTGKVELVEEHLADPLHWRKPQRIFVNSMSDLFHENLSYQAIDQVFAVMALCPQHTFQVLTKRPQRMLDYLNEATCFMPLSFGNVWLGVSVEDQETADERIPLLLQTPAAVRFVSYEPALGPVDLYQYLGGARNPIGSAYGGIGLDWVIVGGESGPGARPFDVASARQTISQCKAADVPCFVKQMGSEVWDRNDSIGDGTPREWPDNTDFDGDSTDSYQGAPMRILLKDRKGGDWNEWPSDLRVRQFPEARR